MDDLTKYRLLMGHDPPQPDADPYAQWTYHGLRSARGKAILAGAAVPKGEQLTLFATYKVEEIEVPSGATHYRRVTTPNGWTISYFRRS